MADNDNIKWVTINGARVPIEKGETTEEALAKLSDKPKHEKTYIVDKGSYKSIVKESEMDKHRYGWYYDVYGDEIFKEVDVEEYLDFIDNLDLNESVSLLHNKLRKQIMMLPQDIRNYLFKELNNKISEYHQKLADDFLSNVPKTSGTQMLEESVMSINKENYDKSKSVSDSHSPEYAAYTYNCQRCAQAFILRYCHGYEVTAKPCERVWNDKKKRFDDAGVDIELDSYAAKNGYTVGSYGVGKSLYNGWHAVIFNFADVNKTLRNGTDIAQEIGYSGTEDQLRWIKNTVKESGPGSAYLCSVCWKGTRRDDGTYSAHVFCVVNDGGKVKFVDPQNGEECSSYFTEKQIVPKQTEIFRADNCRLNGTMMKEVLDYEKNSK